MLVGEGEVEGWVVAIVPVHITLKCIWAIVLHAVAALSAVPLNLCVPVS